MLLRFRSGLIFGTLLGCVVVIGNSSPATAVAAAPLEAASRAQGCTSPPVPVEGTDLYKCQTPGAMSYFVPDLEETRAARVAREKAQAAKLSRERDEARKLLAEIPQAQIDAAILCANEKACKKAFQLTQLFLTDTSDMKLQTVTEVFLETYTPVRRGSLGLRATRSPGRGDESTIRLEPICSRGEYDLVCLRSGLAALRRFKPYVTQRLN